MLIFGLFIIVPVLALYGLFGAICLKLLKIKLSLFTLFLFVLCGVISGISVMYVYGLVVGDKSGTLNSSLEVIGMFVISGFAAVLASIFLMKLLSKYNKALQPTQKPRG